MLLALEHVLMLHQPASGLIINADRGSQYTSTACRPSVCDEILFPFQMLEQQSVSWSAIAV